MSALQRATSGPRRAAAPWAGAACSPSSPGRASGPPRPRSPRAARGAPEEKYAGIRSRCVPRSRWTGMPGGLAGDVPERDVDDADRDRVDEAVRARMTAATARRCSSGSRPTSSGSRKVTICSAIVAGPGPGRLRKLFPSSPSSVRIESTPIGQPPVPRRARTGEPRPSLRSCRTTLTSVIRIGRRRKLDRYPDVAPPNWGARTTAARVRDPSLAISRRRP